MRFQEASGQRGSICSANEEEAMERFRYLTAELHRLAYQMKIIIEAFEIPDSLKKKMKDAIDAFLHTAETTEKKSEKTLEQLRKCLENPQNRQLTKEEIFAAIDPILEKIDKLFLDAELLEQKLKNKSF